MTLSDSRLRWLTFLALGAIVGITFYVHGSFAWIPTLFALNLSLQAPKIREYLGKTNKWLAIGSLILIPVSFAAYPWLPVAYATPALVLANMPWMFQMQKEFQEKAMKRMGIKIPVPAVAAATHAPFKVAKDPSQRTNSYRKYLARIAKGKKKK